MTNRTLEEDLAGLFSDRSDLKAPTNLRMRVAAVPDEKVRSGLVPRLALSAPRIARIAAVVAVLLVAASSAYLRFGTESPAAPGQPLTIMTEAAPTPLPSGASYACPATLSSLSLRVVRSGTQLVVVDATTGSPFTAIWPNGFAARLLDGNAELLASDGAVVAREGDVLTSVNGEISAGESSGGAGRVIHITGFNGGCYTPSGVKVGDPQLPPAATGLGSQEP
jgi:hypothetical protein